MSTAMNRAILLACCLLCACTDLAMQPHGTPASRAVVILPNCFVFCYGRATEIDSGRNTYPPPDSQ